MISRKAKKTTEKNWEQVKKTYGSYLKDEHIKSIVLPNTENN